MRALSSICPPRSRHQTGRNECLVSASAGRISVLLSVYLVVVVSLKPQGTTHLHGILDCRRSQAFLPLLHKAVAGNHGDQWDDKYAQLWGQEPNHVPRVIQGQSSDHRYKIRVLDVRCCVVLTLYVSLIIPPVLPSHNNAIDGWWLNPEPIHA